MLERVWCRQMEWLGHLVRIPSTRIPRQLLFSSLPFPRPFCGPHLRWKDVAARHIAASRVPADWMVIGRDRRKWREEVVCATASVTPSGRLLLAKLATVCFAVTRILSDTSAMLSISYPNTFRLEQSNATSATAGLPPRED